MIVASPVLGWTTAIWGLDMIISTTTGKSMFDHILHGAMTVLGVDENYIGNFRIWGITSNQGWNLILTEALSSGISFGIGAAAKSIGKLGRWAATKIGSNLATGRFSTLARVAASMGEIGNAALKRLGMSMDELLTYGFRKGFAKMTEGGIRSSVQNVVVKGIKEYFELVGEVIFEMAFDSVLRFDKSERPWGGGETFFTAMTLSILTSGALNSLMGKHRSILAVGGTPSTALTKTIRRLTAMCLGLQMSMLAMRIPVLMGNMR